MGSIFAARRQGRGSGRYGGDGEEEDYWKHDGEIGG